MKKIADKTAAILASCCFLVFLLLTLVDVCCFSRSFYSYEYAKNNQAETIGMSDADLMKATDTLLDYLKEKKDSISVRAEIDGVSGEVFTTRESLHMEDVRVLYEKAMTVRNLTGMCSLILAVLICASHRRDRYSILKDGFENGLFMMGSIVTCLTIWAVLDFNDFWLDFHYLFFDNDLFLLDPNDSVMINMFPETFFFDLVILIVIAFVAVCIVVYLVIRKMERKESSSL